MCPIHYLIDEALSIKTETRRISREAFIIKGILVLKEKVVHLPKMALGAGGFGGLGGVLGMGMHIRQREIAKSKAETIAQMLLNGPHDGMRFAAIRTLVIAIFYHSQRRINRPLDMIAPFHWEYQFRFWYAAAHNLSSMQF